VFNPQHHQKQQKKACPVSFLNVATGKLKLIYVAHLLFLLDTDKGFGYMSNQYVRLGTGERLLIISSFAFKTLSYSKIGITWYTVDEF
jgi:hypothetical protein